MYSYPHKTAYRPLENVNLRDYFFNLEGEGHSLYLHLPFCESKCGYCNLFSITGCDQVQMDEYIDAVLRQIKQYGEMLPQSASFGDFTIGGGTPLLLETEQITRVFDAVASGMPMSAGHKIVIETAPNQTDKQKAALLKELGVTRVSMGIQSFDNGELKWLGRDHDSERAREAAGLLAGMGFECVNFDLIYGLPGQTADSLTCSLRTALSFSPDEIFLYPLYIKHGVWLERRGGKEQLDSDHSYALYQCGSGYLRENGYAQVSMRRFVRKKSESVSPKFSECGLKSALSLGCGGRSYLGRLHACTPYRTTRAAALEEIQRFQRTEDFSAVTNGILLSDDEIRRRYVIKHLLILPGLSRQAYRRTFQTDVLKDFSVLRDWMECGWLEEKHADAYDHIALTQEGLGLSDYIGPQLISEEIRAKMLEWERENA
ncbi:MAG: STM4012 family radical SAM protein [Lachnospiraceae bacterium]|nr:STM4012 family radical SAM protein [Lachnospiraceae bacterium]